MPSRRPSRPDGIPDCRPSRRPPLKGSSSGCEDTCGPAGRFDLCPGGLPDGCRDGRPDGRLGFRAHPVKSLRSTVDGKNVASKTTCGHFKSELHRPPPFPPSTKLKRAVGPEGGTALPRKYRKCFTALPRSNVVFLGGGGEASGVDGEQMVRQIRF